MEIRRASIEDIAVMSDIMMKSSAYDGEYRTMLEGYSITEQQIRKDHIYAAALGGEILGFYSLLAERRELDLMFVSDGAQGEGVGQLLFNHMVNLAHTLGLSTIRIVSHPPAEAFYTRMGAHRIGVMPAKGKVTWPRPILEYSVGPHA